MSARHSMVCLEPSSPFQRRLESVWKCLVSHRSQYLPFGQKYRPEKYYMRGPGPQWHAKHGLYWQE